MRENRIGRADLSDGLVFYTHVVECAICVILNCGLIDDEALIFQGVTGLAARRT